MGLYARITAEGPTKINVHRFGAALRQMAAAQLTRQQIIDAFALTGDDVTQFDALIATYTAMGSGNAAQAFAKAAWLDRMEDVFILVETGDYLEAKAKSALGF
jgi:hypothetical protein